MPAPTTVEDLLKPEYQGKVALNGDPTAASAGYHGVMMASLGSGGSADDIAPGVEFFKKLKASGNLLPVDPTPATIASGQTPVVIDWDYLNAAQTTELAGKVDWKVVVPQNAVVGAYYVQAINKDAPHPAAARLWQEFLYSPEGQNIWLKGFARPVLADEDGRRRHDRPGRLRQAADHRRHAGGADPGAADQGAGLPEGQLGGRGRLTGDRDVTDVVAPTSVPGSEPAPPATGSGGAQRLRRATPYLGVLPFLVLRDAVPALADLHRGHRRLPGRDRGAHD